MQATGKNSRLLFLEIGLKVRRYFVILVMMEACEIEPCRGRGKREPNGEISVKVFV